MTTSAESGASKRTAAPLHQRIGRWSLAAAMAGSALAIGTVHTVTLCVVAVLLAVAAAAVWWTCEPIRVRPAASLLLAIGLALVGYTILQCVPMPIGLLRVLAPQNADIWSRALAPLHEAEPGWAPLTLDPPATRVEALRGVTYLLAFLAALRIAHRREGVAFLHAVIVVTALSLALAALLHPAFGAKRLYGIYDPGPGVAESHIAPLLNPNNLAGYLNVGFCLILAASLSPEPRVPRAIAVALAALLAAAQVWVGSRGGVIAMVLGGAAVGALSLGERIRRRDPRALLSAVCGAATLVGGVLIVLGSSEKAKGELVSSDVTKFVALLDVMKMLPAHGLFGVGRGAFESAFARFREAPGHLVATNPENIVAQWVSEWGIPVGVAGLVAIAVALRPTAALARSRSAAGAWAAVAAIAAQNMADFSSEIPGVMISVVVCGAVVVAGTAG
ncbi:MAG: O-antigen ligase family protein, partial [Myxococcales bacterium]|nr:O-antigen ligase family protein [Myxococcales bacterium]